MVLNWFDRLTKRQADYKTSHIFFLWSMFHLTLWTVMPWLTRANLPFDSAEGVAWGQLWQWGYDKHPPLAPWLTAFAYNLGGDGAIYLLAQLAIIATFFAVWRLGCEWMSEKRALIGTVLLEGIYYYHFASPQFNPNVLMLPTWAFSCWLFYLALDKEKLVHWFLLGFVFGLAMLTKYQSVILLPPMFAVLLTTEKGRRAFFSPGPYVALIVAILVFLPNLSWLIQHDFVPFTYTSARLASHNTTISPAMSHWYFPLRFFVEQLAAVLALFLLFIPLRGRSSFTYRYSPFVTRFVTLMTFGPLVTSLLISALLGVWLHALWGFPYFSLLGLWLVTMRRPQCSDKQIRHFTTTVIILMVLTVTIRGFFLYYGPALQGKVNAAHYPGEAIANDFTTMWETKYQTPLHYIAGDHTIMINFAAYSKDKPQPFFGWDKKRSAWIDETRMRKEGAVFVWMTNVNEPVTLDKNILTRFPRLERPVMRCFSYRTGTKANIKPLCVAYAFLPPASSA